MTTLSRRNVLKGGAAFAAGTTLGAPMIWAQNIKDVTLRQFGTGVSNLNDVANKVKEDLGFTLEMTALVWKHATNEGVRQMALRMEISQRDEIKMMKQWLTDRGQPVGVPMGDMGGMHAHHNMSGGMHHSMPGMLTPQQMEELANARGVEFDRLFLEGMIQHHQGAIDMVETLFNAPGAAQESTIFKFAEDVDADQQMEIDRMRGLLRQLR